MRAEEALDELLEACPSYRDAADLAVFVASFEEEDQPDLFVRTAALAHQLVMLVGADSLDEPARVFERLEFVLEHGDGDALELMRLGLIESLQNITSHEDVGVDPARIEALLGPGASEVWGELEILWGEASQTLDEWPRVTQEDYRNVVDPNLRRYLQAGKRCLSDGTLMSVSDVVRHQMEIAGAPGYTPARLSARISPVVIGAALLVVLIAVAVAVFR